MKLMAIVVLNCLIIHDALSFCKCVQERGKSSISVILFCFVWCLAWKLLQLFSLFIRWWRRAWWLLWTSTWTRSTLRSPSLSPSSLTGWASEKEEKNWSPEICPRSWGYFSLIYCWVQVYLCLLSGLLEGYFVPLYDFHLTPQVPWCFFGLFSTVKLLLLKGFLRSIAHFNKKLPRLVHKQDIYFGVGYQKKIKLSSMMARYHEIWINS